MPHSIEWNKRPPRVCIENVEPEIDGGRFAVKRTVLDAFIVQADIHADGHDVLAAAVLYRRAGSSEWSEAPMTLLGNDRWQGSFIVPQIGKYEYTIQGWIDRFESWRSGFIKKTEAGQDVAPDLLIGADLMEAAAGRAPEPHDDFLRNAAARLRDTNLPLEERIGIVMDREIDRVARLYPDRSTGADYGKILAITVDPERARFSTWYEIFPRSCASEPGRHGTFRDCREKLAYVAEMGFDVLYFPPIHPIGRTNRKGKNNAAEAELGDVGSPWAIGSEEGGHKSIDPQLGTLDEFRTLVNRAREHGIEIALDLAFQCSPDHPWLREHPDWFRRRPDGSIQYAENPPKKYEDIVPLDFETGDWKALYQELLSVVLFWIDQGVRIFRVDNPHTKPYPFWEWMIGQVKKVHPEIIFLSEAFTRPKVMYCLAKLGYTQSYTYFTWRQTAKEIRDYMTELTRTTVSEFFRPNLWPNTPDILPEHLQAGGRPAFQLRLVLAATLGSNYGIYGPAFELCEDVPLGPGLEEYLDSEKFVLREWNREQAGNLRPLISKVNAIRRENRALQSNRNLQFHSVTNDNLLAYSKHTDDKSNIILVVANLNVHHVQSGYVDLPLAELNVETMKPFQVHDLLSGQRYLWSGPRNYLELDPKSGPARIFRLRRYLRTERDFDYYL